PAQQGGGPARPAGVPAVRQQGRAPEEARGGAEEPGGLSEPGDQRGGDLEHGLYGGGDRAASGRRPDGEGGGHCPTVAGPVRAHQPLRQVPVRGRGGIEPLPLAAAPPTYWTPVRVKIVVFFSVAIGTPIRPVNVARTVA